MQFLVNVQTSLLDDVFLTDSAHRRVLTPVQSFVPVQVTLKGEALVAESTGIGPLPSVCSQAVDGGGRERKILLANFAADFVSLHGVIGGEPG